MQGVTLETERFRLRTLTEDDATARYLSWLDDGDSRRNILYARQRRSLDDLRGYIAIRRESVDAAFFGIFDRATGAHIGNLKYEPIDRTAGWTVMGILIGEPSWRGKGVTPEVLEASGRWLKDTFGIKEILLGVLKGNAAAVRAYEKAGFRPDETGRLPVDPEGLAMARVLA